MMRLRWGNAPRGRAGIAGGHSGTNMPFMVILWVVSSLGLGKISPGPEERTAIVFLGAINAPQTAVLAKLQDSWAVLMEQVRFTLKSFSCEYSQHAIDSGKVVSEGLCIVNKP